MTVCSARNDAQTRHTEQAEPSLTDLTVFARTVWRFAAREPEQGQAAVAWTVLNRTLHARRHVAGTGRPHPIFGDGSIAAACRSHGTVADAMCPPAGFGDRDMCRALAVACLSLGADLGDPTEGATHFHDHLTEPRWAKGAKPTALIGRYLFYRLPH